MKQARSCEVWKDMDSLLADKVFPHVRNSYFWCRLRISRGALIILRSVSSQGLIY